MSFIINSKCHPDTLKAYFQAVVHGDEVERVRLYALLVKQSRGEK